VWPWLVAAAVVIGGLVATLVIVLTGEDEPAVHVVDEQAWRDAKHAQDDTIPEAKWADYVDLWVNDVCKDDAGTLRLLLAMRMDDGAEEESLRTDFTYACPDRLPEFEEFMSRQ
jgi:hypothetical protein